MALTAKSTSLQVKHVTARFILTNLAEKEVIDTLLGHAGFFLWHAFTAQLLGAVRWADTDKGGDGVTDIRSRLVARDFKMKGNKNDDDLYASTPPLEAIRMLVSRAATTVWGEKKQEDAIRRREKGALEPTMS